MPRAHEQVLKATALRDVVAAVPFQCGFHPRRSVVVLSLRGPRKRVGQVTRADLPEPEDVDDAVAELARSWCGTAAPPRWWWSTTTSPGDRRNRRTWP